MRVTGAQAFPTLRNGTLDAPAAVNDKERHGAGGRAQHHQRAAGSRVDTRLMNVCSRCSSRVAQGGLADSDAQLMHSLICLLIECHDALHIIVFGGRRSATGPSDRSPPGSKVRLTCRVDRGKTNTASICRYRENLWLGERTIAVSRRGHAGHIGRRYRHIEAVLAFRDAATSMWPQVRCRLPICLVLTIYPCCRTTSAQQFRHRARIRCATGNDVSQALSGGRGRSICRGESTAG